MTFLYTCATTRTRFRERGATLAEVLVSVAILSLGLLAAATLLNESLQLLGDNRNRQRAVRLAADLAELLGHADAKLAASLTTPAKHDCVSSICNPDQFLEDSARHWQERIDQFLPEGSGEVELLMSDGRAVAQITVRWQQSRSETAMHRMQVALLPGI